MKTILIASIIAIASSAFADMTGAMLDRDQFVAVATAVVAQSKVRFDQRIQAISKSTAPGVFFVQLVDGSAQCVEIGANVSVIPNSGERPQYNVDFPRVAPRPCK